MSSLQRAINDADKLKLKKFDSVGSSIGRGGGSGGGGGTFENSFAQGLDISELISPQPTRTSTITTVGERKSAADELLRIKEGERRQRQIQEEKESKMQEALQKRVNSLKCNSISKNNINNAQRSSFEIGHALVRMHGTDETAAAILSQKTNNRKGATISRRRNPAQQQHQRSSTTIRMSNNNKNFNNNTYSKPPLLKKSRRSKF